MAKITDLPVELLEKILSLTHNSALDCTRVCWKFNTIATRVLYRNVHLIGRCGARFDDFSRTIIGQPDLGRHVRYLFAFLGYCPRDISPIFATEAASRGLSREIQQAIENGCLGAITFLLLFYLPALRKLRIFTTSSQYLLSMQIRHARSLPSGLQSVQSVHLTTPSRWDVVQQFFNLPAVDTMTWRIYPEKNAPYINPPCASNLKHIRIASDHLPCDALNLLIRSSPSLRTLQLVGVPEDCPLTLPSPGHTMRDCVVTTLRDLDLDFSYGRQSPKTGSIGSLRDFVHLTRVRASFSSLLGYPPQDNSHAIAHRLSDTLPQSLVSLVLLVDMDWMDLASTVVEELVRGRREWLVHLKILAVDGLIESDALAQLKLACVAEGMEWGTPDDHLVLS